MKYTDDLKNITKLAWPAIIQEAMAVVVSYVDTAMVGALGASASAAVGLTSTVSWLTGSIGIGLGIGVLSICAQADGANDPKKMKIAGQQAFFIAMFVGILLTIICLGISPYLPAWLNGDISIQKEASIYFAIVSTPYLFRSFLMVFDCALRGVSDMKTPMIMSVLTNIINIILNFFLIYETREVFGLTIWGANLGVKGAAIASAIAYTIGGSFIFLKYMNTKEFGIHEEGFHYNPQIMKECLTIGFPVMLERGIICLGHVVFSSIVATLGVIPFAAHTIALQAEQAFYVPGYGFQSAVATLVGNSVGKKDENGVKRITKLTAGLCFILMSIAGILLYIFSTDLMMFFTQDNEVIQLGTQVLKIVAFSEPIFGVLIILEGCFNGMGDTKAPFIFSIFTMWMIRILGTLIVIHIFHQGLQVIWVIMVFDNVTRCALLFHRFITGKWRKLCM